MDVSVFCDNCGEKFAAKYKLLDHIKNAHDDNAYPCDDCNKIFIGKWKLKNHKETHKTIECTKCKSYIPEKETVPKISTIFTQSLWNLLKMTNS